MAAACLYVYDWTITLDMEVELVWKSNRSYINVLYLVQRYLPFIDTCFIGMWRASPSEFHLKDREIDACCTFVLLLSRATWYFELAAMQNPALFYWMYVLIFLIASGRGGKETD